MGLSDEPLQEACRRFTTEQPSQVMGNYAIILALAGAVGLSSILYSSRQATTGADAELNLHVHKVLAREASLTGINLTIRKLAADTTSWSINPAKYGFTDTDYKYTTFTTFVDPGTYVNGVVVDGCSVDTVDVISTGTASPSVQIGTGVVQHVVETTYARNCDAAGGSPSSLAYPLVADNELRIESSVKVYSSVDTLNANIHANGQLVTNGFPEIQGYGTYTTPGGKCDPCEGYNPNDDINGPDPNTYQADEVTIFDPDIPSYEAIAHYVSAGDVIYSSDAVLDFTDFNGVTGAGTSENPFIWYINGSLKFNANVSTSGYVMIFATNTIEVGSNVQIYSSAAGGVVPPTSTVGDPNTEAVRPWMATYMPTGVTLGMYSAGLFQVGGSSIVMGQMYSGGNFEMTGTATIFGSATSKGDIKATGTLMIWFAEPDNALLELTAGPELGSGALKLLSYVEW